jgi:hypothetical protein
MNNTPTTVIRPAHTFESNEAYSHYLNAVRATLNVRQGYDGSTQAICDADADALAAAIAAYNKNVAGGGGGYDTPYNDALDAADTIYDRAIYA